VQGRGYTPYSAEADEACESQNGEEVHERRSGQFAQGEGATDPAGGEGYGPDLLLPWGQGDNLLLLCDLFSVSYNNIMEIVKHDTYRLRGFRNGRRWSRWGGSWPQHLALVRDDGAADHLVVEVDAKVILLPDWQ
jgi:hypothetical protein